MLDLDNADTIEGLSVYGDTTAYHRYYYLPDRPNYRLDRLGRPLFRFIKYRLPVGRPDGRTGGGFLSFGVELTVAEDRLRAIRSTLQRRVNAEAERRGVADPPDVALAPPSYTSGSVQLNLTDEVDGTNVLVERVHAARTPALFGTNTATFFAELTPEGATVLESALQGIGGFLTVHYELLHQAQLPPLVATGTFRASEFYRFVQEIDVEERWGEDDYTETLNEAIVNSESRRISFDRGGVTDPDVANDVRDSVLRALDDAIERTMLEAIPPEDAEEAKKLYEEKDIENVSRTILRWRVNDIRIQYDERATIEVPANPNGPLPSITSLVDGAGDPIVWDDYAATVDADDPFFRQVRIDVGANADFTSLPIHSVEVKLSYRGRPMALIDDGQAPAGEHRFTNADDTVQFASFIEDDDNTYTYSYQVNYEGESRIFQSEERVTDDRVLTVGVDDVGILRVDLSPGDINWTQVAQAQVVMQYEDQANGVGLIEQQFLLNEESPNDRFQEIIFTPRQQPYRYRVTYFMQDGREYSLDWMNLNGDQLYVNDPFSATKRVGLRAAGDLEQEIENIFVDLAYLDEANDYRQSVSVALNQRQPFYDWSFPVIDESAGSVSYSGTIVYRSGRTTAIPETVATSTTPIVGEAVADRLSVLVLADLIDFAQVRLVRLALSYDDPANDILERTDIVFGGRRPTEASWTIDLADRDAVDYEYRAQFFMADGTRLDVGPVATSDLTIVLEVPEG